MKKIFCNLVTLQSRGSGKYKSPIYDPLCNLQYHQNKVLFLRGNLNLVANYEHQLKLAKHFPKYEIATINGAGHYVLYEKYNEARRIILNYFKGE